MVYFPAVKWHVTLAVLAGASLGQFAPVHAQAPPASTTRHVQISAVTLPRFETAMQAISQQGHITILAEGAPLHAEATGESLATLQQSVPVDKPLPLDDALANVAAAFDYDVEPVNAHLYLLHKHYSDPEDLPLITYDEMVHALSEMLKVVKPYASDAQGAPKYASALRLVKSLSPEQRAAAAVTALPVAALDAEQRQWVIETENAYCFGDSVKNLEENLHRLQVLSNSRTQISGGIQGESYSLAYTDHSFDDIESLSTRLFEFKLSPHEVEKNHVSFDLPQESYRLAAGMMATSLPETMTLQAAATQNLPGLLAGKSSEIRVRVDKAIGMKPVTMFGTSFSTRPHFIRALAALYHSELIVPNEKSFTLTLPTAQATQNIDGIGPELRRLMPPLFRASYYVKAEKELQPKKQLPEVFMHQLYWYVAVANRLMARLFPDSESRPATFRKTIIETGDETVRLIAIELFTFFNFDMSVGESNGSRSLPYYLTASESEFIFLKEKPDKTWSLGFGKGQEGQNKSRSTYDVPLPPSHE